MARRDRTYKHSRAMPPRRKRARTEEADEPDAAQAAPAGQQEQGAAVDAGTAAGERREAMAAIARR